jgi:hypothetical protein
MMFPEKVTVVVRDRETGLSVNGVAILLMLFAARKNDYSVGPFITDEHGAVNFTRAECEFTIKQAREMFLMDYNNSLGECRPFVDIQLHPHELVEGMIRQYRAAPKFWGLGFPDPERLFAALENVKNAEYAQSTIRATEAQLLAQPHLELLLSRSDKIKYGEGIYPQ